MPNWLQIRNKPTTRLGSGTTRGTSLIILSIVTDGPWKGINYAQTVQYSVIMQLCGQRDFIYQYWWCSTCTRIRRTHRVSLKDHRFHKCYKICVTNICLNIVLCNYYSSILEQKGSWILAHRIDASLIKITYYKAVILNWRFCLNYYRKVTHTVQEGQH